MSLFGRTRPPAWLLAAWLLGSCGGGGGSDPEPPPAPQMISLTSPANLADGVRGTITLAATPNTGFAVVAVEFQVDGSAAGAEDTSAPFATTFDTDRLARGQHVVRARARDAAGMRSAWVSATIRTTGGGDVPAGFGKIDNWVRGLATATAFAQAPDGRLFVAEQGGALRVVKNGVLLPAPFHTFAVNSEGERGLIGVALHPNFAANGYVYAYHTRVAGGVPHNRVTRLVAAGDVSSGAETTILDLPSLGASNHNGGALKFGTDGTLFVGVGDNADRSKPQDLSHPFGKVLRLRDDGGIPADNPFAGSQSGLGRAVWAYGLRNPFTLAVQPGSGRLHINDVGELTWEEINLGAAGANYGWPSSEGPSGVRGDITGPLFAYNHSEASPPGSGPGGFITGNAIAGGAFYPASGPFPAAYRGNYFFADFTDRFVAVLDLANGNAATTFALLSGLPVDMLVGNDGALYVLTLGAITRIAAL